MPRLYSPIVGVTSWTGWNSCDHPVFIANTFLSTAIFNNFSDPFHWSGNTGTSFSIDFIVKVRDITGQSCHLSCCSFMHCRGTKKKKKHLLTVELSAIDAGSTSGHRPLTKPLLFCHRQRIWVLYLHTTVLCFRLFSSSSFLGRKGQGCFKTEYLGSKAV